MDTVNTHLHLFLRRLLLSMIATYFTLELLESLHPGFVSNFMNTNYLVAVILMVGLGVVVTE